jgi:hypothetical protein
VAPDADILVRYRVSGGPAAVDQRLTLFEDGAAELDERHRSRDAVQIRLDRGELDAIREALEGVPAARWAGRGRRVLARAGRSVKDVPRRMSHAPPGALVEVSRGARAIVDPAAGDPDLDALVTLLDAARVRAIRSEPR